MKGIWITVLALLFIWLKPVIQFNIRERLDARKRRSERRKILSSRKKKATTRKGERQ